MRETVADASARRGDSSAREERIVNPLGFLSALIAVERGWRGTCVRSAATPISDRRRLMTLDFGTRRMAMAMARRSATKDGHVMRAHSHFTWAGLLIGLLFFGAGHAIAAPLTCDVTTPTECQITTLKNLGAGGTFQVDRTLHIGAAGELRTNPGSTLALDVAGDFIVDVGGKVTGNAASTGNNSGATIAITATGSVFLDGNGSGGAVISADQPPRLVLGRDGRHHPHHVHIRLTGGQHHHAERLADQCQWPLQRRRDPDQRHAGRGRHPRARRVGELAQRSRRQAAPRGRADHDLGFVQPHGERYRSGAQPGRRSGRRPRPSGSGR